METMNPTLIVLFVVLMVHVVTCMLQWRRLSRGDKGSTGGPDFRQRAQ
jgi:hypothetical protein